MICFQASRGLGFTTASRPATRLCKSVRCCSISFVLMRPVCHSAMAPATPEFRIEAIAGGADNHRHGDTTDLESFLCRHLTEANRGNGERNPCSFPSSC